MAFFRKTLSNFHEVIDFVCQYIQHLPPNARSRLSTWMLLERVLRKPAQPPSGKQLPGKIQTLIENQVSLFSGYMVLFAHDDAVDKYNLDTVDIYEQLSRCLAAFLMSTPLQDEPRTAGALRYTMNKWSVRMQAMMVPYPQIAVELPCLFDNPSLLYGIPDNEPLTIQHLFFKHEYDSLCREWLNMTIVSALGMGQTFRKISSLIKQHLQEDDAILLQHCEFLVKILIQCMYAQAHSAEQKNLNTIRYGRYVELATMKSTIFLDIRNYVSDQVNEPRFFGIRHNSSRWCDQFIDDLQDFEEDTRDGVLGILHVQIIEQGLLAEKFLAISENQQPSIALVQELLHDTQILRTTYEQTFIYQNPYIRSARDSQGNLRMQPTDAETILREIWVNAPSELGWTVEKLARHRLALYVSFKTAWQENNIPTVLDIIHQSNLLMAFLKTLQHFMRQNKQVIIESYKRYGAHNVGYISYYFVIFAIQVLWLDVWKKRISRSKHIGQHMSQTGDSL